MDSSKLNNVFSESRCLTSEELLLYFKGKLDAKQKRQTEHHLSSCEACSDELEGISLATEKNIIVPEKDLNAIITRSIQKEKKRDFGQILRIAAIVLVFFVSGILIYIFRSTSDRSTESHLSHTAAEQKPEDGARTISEAEPAKGIDDVVNQTGKDAERKEKADNGKKQELNKAPANTEKSGDSNKDAKASGMGIDNSYKVETQSSVGMGATSTKNVVAEFSVTAADEDKSVSTNRNNKEAQILSENISDNKLQPVAPVTDESSSKELNQAEGGLFKKSKKKSEPEKEEAKAKAEAGGKSDRAKSSSTYTTELLADEKVKEEELQNTGYDNDKLIAIGKYRKGNYSEALQLYEKLLKQIPDDHEVLYFGGMTYYNLNLLDKALPVLRKCSEQKGKGYTDEAEYYLAKAYIKTGSNDKAAILLKKISKNKGKYKTEADEMLLKLKD